MGFVIGNGLDYGELLHMSPLFVDGDQIVKMLLPLLRIEEDAAPRYTCRNFDWLTNECTIYAQRPSMCRGHGESYTCHYPGCPLPRVTDRTTWRTRLRGSWGRRREPGVRTWLREVVTHLRNVGADGMSKNTPSLEHSDTDQFDVLPTAFPPSTVEILVDG